ncbi:hypothetical protein C6H64_03840 [Photorhabdus luminescens]|uniref:Lipoprotein n=1 Tax=Photorhabdus namnaonensis TaxID=1851568 RepID=A0A1B8YJ50_9GAMM|nr:hypothetical protein [Photorhabdus namnaonensis]OCA55117.1 hypothetical protein Phpb_01735 [Photorhabdus namnaonensis]PQQ32070.1 hypothetical protein C6H64_03840 [Photorhabdus luminescens]
MMKKIKYFTIPLSMLLTACSTTQLYEEFPATNGTMSQAYCTHNLWTDHALKYGKTASNIIIHENRSGYGSFYVFEEKGDEIVQINGTYGIFGKHEGDIDVRFYIPKDKPITPLSLVRLKLTKICASLPSATREEVYLPNTICTDLSGCKFRNK